METRDVTVASDELDKQPFDTSNVNFFDRIQIPSKKPPKHIILLADTTFGCPVPWFKSLKETYLGVAQALFDPIKGDHTWGDYQINLLYWLKLHKSCLHRWRRLLFTYYFYANRKKCLYGKRDFRPEEHPKRTLKLVSFNSILESPQTILPQFGGGVGGAVRGSQRTLTAPADAPALDKCNAGIYAGSLV